MEHRCNSCVSLSLHIVKMERILTRHNYMCIYSILSSIDFFHLISFVYISSHNYGLSHLVAKYTHFAGSRNWPYISLHVNHNPIITHQKYHRCL